MYVCCLDCAVGSGEGWKASQKRLVYIRSACNSYVIDNFFAHHCRRQGRPFASRQRTPSTCLYGRYVPQPAATKKMNFFVTIFSARISEAISNLNGTFVGAGAVWFVSLVHVYPCMGRSAGIGWCCRPECGVGEEVRVDLQ